MNKYMLDFYKKIIEQKLDEFMPVQYPEKIWHSMRYSVLAGGKRLRPAMVLESCRICGGDFEDAIACACALEMLHVQSLIHDDLPCMDNDDLRRGKPTNHKAFEEATAVLAGDALLFFAPEVILKYTPSSVSALDKIEILSKFFDYGGAKRLIAGQIVDIDSENKKIDEKTLDFIHKNKTSALFELSVFCGGKIAKASDTQMEALDSFAKNFGLAFQIYDDIIDIVLTTEELGKTAGKDEKEGKQTYPNMYGLETSYQKLFELIKNAEEILIKNKLESILFKGILEGIKEKVKG